MNSSAATGKSIFYAECSWIGTDVVGVTATVRVRWALIVASVETRTLPGVTSCKLCFSRRRISLDSLGSRRYYDGAVFSAVSSCGWGLMQRKYGVGWDKGNFSAGKGNLRIKARSHGPSLKIVSDA